MSGNHFLNCLPALSFSILSGKCSCLSGFIFNCSSAKSMLALELICCFKVICLQNTLVQAKSSHAVGYRGRGGFETVLYHGSAWAAVRCHHSIHPAQGGTPSLPSGLHLPLSPKMFARHGYFDPRLRVEVDCSLSTSEYLCLGGGPCQTSRVDSAIGSWA